MGVFKDTAVRSIAGLGPKYMPFADVASAELPLSRLLRLSLFQVSVGMALVLLVGTLNRVMIVELGVPASLVALMIALPVLFAPFRAFVGYRSDVHVSALGWRRVPFIWKGTMLQFGGFAVMPFALLVLAGWGESADAPAWVGITGAAIAFLLVGAGVHMVQTVGLALATDLAPPESQPKVVGLMYIMLMVGMIVSALVFGALLEDFNAGKLIRVIQGAAVVTIVLNLIALWKQEPRDRIRAQLTPDDTPFIQMWAKFINRPGALRQLIVIGLGTAGFGMADVLLEPYGGQVLSLSVSDTTRLTAVLATGGIIGLALSSNMLGRGMNPLTMSGYGAFVGLPAFAAVIMAAPLQSNLIFVGGTLFIGFGAGLFSHGTLTSAMRSAPPEQAGLALGAWGAVQATTAGVGIVIGGIIRDLLIDVQLGGMDSVATAYIAVYIFEIVLLVLTLIVVWPLISRPFTAKSETPSNT